MLRMWFSRIRDITIRSLSRRKIALDTYLSDSDLIGTDQMVTYFTRQTSDRKIPCLLGGGNAQLSQSFGIPFAKVPTQQIIARHQLHYDLTNFGIA